jgi:hypothetical protein
MKKQMVHRLLPPIDPPLLRYEKTDGVCRLIISTTSPRKSSIWD